MSNITRSENGRTCVGGFWWNKHKGGIARIHRYKFNEKKAVVVQEVGKDSDDHNVVYNSGCHGWFAESVGVERQQWEEGEVKRNGHEKKHQCGGN